MSRVRLVRIRSMLEASLALAVLASWGRADAPERVEHRRIDDLARRVSWQPPTTADLDSRIGVWLESAIQDTTRRESLLTLWRNSAEAPALDRVVALIATADPRAAELVQYCRAPVAAASPPEFSILRDSQVARFAVDQLRLYFGRYLAQQKLYDESIVQLDGLDPSDVVDPASLLFFQGLAHHALVEKEPSLDALARLLECKDELPRRYMSLAELMQADLKRLKDDETLEHISRRMDDVRRRLDIGREEPKVREVEDGIVKSLDKLIEKIEDAMQQQQSAAQMAPRGGGQSPAQPQFDKLPPPIRGTGDVTPKQIAAKGGWGNLPPKQRQEAMQQIGKEFPAHYRDVIEQYFRKQAAQADGE